MDLVQTIQQQLLPSPPVTRFPTMPWHIEHTISMAKTMCEVQEWSAFIREYFPNAVLFRFESSTEYDDEGGYYRTVNDVLLYDADGKLLDKALLVGDDQYQTWCDELLDMGVPSDHMAAQDSFAVYEVRNIGKTRQQIEEVVLEWESWLSELPDACFVPENSI